MSGKDLIKDKKEFDDSGWNIFEINTPDGVKFSLAFKNNIVAVQQILPSQQAHRRGNPSPFIKAHFLLYLMNLTLFETF